MLIILNRCLFCADMHVQKYKAKYCLKKNEQKDFLFSFYYIFASGNGSKF